MTAARPAGLLILAALLSAAAGPLASQTDRPDQGRIAQDLPATLPLLPQPDAMLFPNAPRRLNIAGPRARALLDDALKGDRIIGLIMLRPGNGPGQGERRAVFSIGCAGLITNVEELPDGRVNVLLRGLVKFRVTGEEENGGRTYRVGRVVAIPEVSDALQASALKAQRERVDDLLSLSIDHFGMQLPPLAVPDEDVVNVVSQYAADLNPIERQALLEQEGVLARSRALVDLLELHSRIPH